MVDRLLVVLVLPLILLLSLVLLLVVLVAVLEVLSSGAARIVVAIIAATTKAKGLMMGAMFRFGRRSILDRFVRLQILLKLNPSQPTPRFA